MGRQKGKALKDKTRKQLLGMEISTLREMMQSYFVSNCNSWQAEVLEYMIEESTEAYCAMVEYIIEKLINEVSPAILAEDGWIHFD